MRQQFRKNGGGGYNNIPIISFDEARGRSEELWILIASTKYGDEIESELIKHIDTKYIYNMQQAFRQRSQTSMFSLDSQKKIKHYTSMLRGQIPWETQTLPTPEDMPEEAKQVVNQLKVYYDAYEKGIDMEIPIDNYYIKREAVDFFADSSWETHETVNLIEFLNQSRYRGGVKIYGEDKKTVHWIKEMMLEKTKLDICVCAENISQFYHYVNQKNIPFLYVQLPNELSTCEVELPNGQKDYQNPEVTEFLEQLKSVNVPFLDYREVMGNQNIQSLDMFYRTDLHWKQQSAFDATISVCRELERLYGFCFQEDKLAFDAYRKIVYPSLYFGPYCLKMGFLYSGIDDFELFLPKYETDYSYICENRKFQKKGNAEQALLFPSHLCWDFYNVNPYATYGLANFDHIKIINHNNKQGKKVLCLRDSFTSPMAMFLCPQFSEVHFIDIRTNKQSNKRIVDKQDVFRLLEENEFDLVLMMHWVLAITNNPNVSDINPYTK